MTIQSGNTTPKTSFPDMSGLTKQLKNVTTQFAVLNDRFTDIGSQLQLMADVLSYENITTTNAVFSSIATDTGENQGNMFSDLSQLHFHLLSMLMVKSKG